MLQLGDQKGMVFKPAPEEEALSRWAHGDFLDVERQFAKRWRRDLNSINFSDMINQIMDAIGGTGGRRNFCKMRSRRPISSSITWTPNGSSVRPRTDPGSRSRGICAGGLGRPETTKLAGTSAVFHVLALHQSVFLLRTARAIAAKRKVQPPDRPCLSVLPAILRDLHVADNLHVQIVPLFLFPADPLSTATNSRRI